MITVNWDMTPCMNNLLPPKLRDETEVSSCISVNFRRTRCPQVGRDSVFGITSRYGLDGPGIEYRRGASFPAPFQTVPGIHQASYTIGTVYLSRG